MKAKKDSWGHPALTAAQVQASAESFIPEKLRPYYVKFDVMKHELSEPYSEWNTDICLYFKYPVVGAIDDARYAHSDLYHMKEELLGMEIDTERHTEELAKYDADTDKLPMLPIKALRRKLRWHKVGYDGSN